MTAARGAGKPRLEAEAKMEWVPIPLMRISAMAQRDVNPTWVRELSDNMDLEQLGFLTVNHRDGQVYVIDGQHRVDALRLHGYGDQQVQCRAYYNLTEEEEAEMFLRLNDQLAVNAFAKFKVGVTAKRPDEVAIDSVVRSCGLRVSKGKSDGSVSAVATLRKVYQIGGVGVLARTLCLVRDSFGDPGLDASVIMGLALIVHRYGSDLDQEKAVKHLSSVMGGVHGLLGKAEVLRRGTGNPKSHCVAAAAVDVYNAGRGGRKLAPWWQEANGKAPAKKLASA